MASWVDDVNFGYFTVPQVSVFLNNAQRECQKLLLQAGQNYYTHTVQTNLVSSQQAYVLPDDFFDLHRLSVVTSGTGPSATRSAVTFITTNQQDLVTNQSGVPAFYNILRNRLMLYPIPNVTYPLEMIYSPSVTNMVLDTDEPNAPDVYHEFIAVLATIDCFLKDGRDMTAFLAKRAYYENMMKQASTERLVDGPRQIVETGQWNSGSNNYGYW